MNKILRTMTLCVIFWAWGGWVSAQPAAVDSGYVVDHHLSRIEGSIKYSVVGRYTARFEDYEGVFYFDPDHIEASSVVLKIKAASLVSKFPSLDKIVLSPQLLDSERYPEVSFKSTSMRRTDKPGIYAGTGLLTLHGVTKEIQFQFNVEGPYQDHNNDHVRASGEWIINRKDFNIYWHPFLDKGGILVGNHMTVDWEIVAFKKSGPAVP